MLLYREQMRKGIKYRAHWGRSLGPLALVLAFLSPAFAGETGIIVSGEDVVVGWDAGGYALFSGPDIQYFSQPGEPAIPYRVVNVLLPPGAVPSSVTATTGGAVFEKMPGTWSVKPEEPPSTWDGTRTITVWPDDKTIVAGRDVAVYGKDALFPGQIMERVTSGSMRGWQMASVPVALFRYNPVQGTLLRLTECELSVGYSEMESALLDRSSASDRIASERLKNLAVNYDTASRLYGAGRESSTDFSGTTYAIITTGSIQSALTNLDRFTINKEARGFTVQVVTESTWGGGTGNTAAENIRSWLQSNYTTLNIEYVLLIGNPHPTAGNVPMKMCHPYQGNCPTDYYYADLTGNWDLNGNGNYGEWGDFGAGGIDRNYEVAVGRIITYGDDSVADAALDKIIEYENTLESVASWRHNILLPIVQFDGGTLMYQLGEQLKNYAIAPKGWSYHRIYQSDYGVSPETVGISMSTVTNTWNASQFGAVIWTTHGSATSASSVMNTSYAATLSDTHPSFTYQGSCTNSSPETTNNLSYMLLQNGCIATVGATRLPWYNYYQTYFPGTATIGGVGYEYGYRLIADEMTCGIALCDLRQDVSPGANYRWQNYVVFNIYGDPSLGIDTTLVDSDSDGMPDYWEITYFGDISNGAGGDYDLDELGNLLEYLEGTDPSDNDTDGDGLSDGDEIDNNADPLDSDTDDDGLDDGDEIANGTDPNNTDSDDDHLSDGEEVNTHGSSPLIVDSDSDGWCDVIEAAGGSDPNDPGSVPSSFGISFQLESTTRPDDFAPSGTSSYRTDLGYGWM